MSFVQINFLFIFLPVYILALRVLPIKFQKILLILGGLLFYAFGQKSLVVLLGVSVALNFGLHRWISYVKNKIPLLIVTVGINAGLLVLCKILGFLPLGVSFYTFQIISMQIDLRNEKTRIDDFAAMALYFPKLVMGPLVRYSEFKDKFEEMKTKRLVTLAGVEEGLKLFTAGMFMKVVIADNLATLWNSINVAGSHGITTSVAWLGAVTYTIELYLDFWGYSLMAVALGKMTGMPVPENFNEPYSSMSVGEFWRRWHITLGAWFRDYVFIPLGGSKKGAFRNILNLLIVWILTGIWHGWGVNFLVWSGILFTFIVLEKFTPLGKITKIKGLGNVYLILVIVLSWVAFAIKSPQELLDYAKCLFGIPVENASPARTQFIRYIRTYWYLIAGGLFMMTPFPRKLWTKFSGKWWMNILAFAMFALSVYFIHKGMGNNFMYYAF